MLSQAQLRDELIKLLSGEISLDQFDEWFAKESWNLHHTGDLAAQRLAYAVELRLGEYDSGHLPENDLVSELKNLLRAASFSSDSHVVSGSNASFSYHRWPSQLVDRSLSKAS